MLFRSIHLQNFLSFGEDSPTIPLQNLNVLIGPNGSGKSNLLEAFALLKSTPKDMHARIREGGGVRDWLRRSGDYPIATLKAVVAYPDGPSRLRYRLSFSEQSQHFRITDERVENKQPLPGYEQPYFYLWLCPLLQSSNIYQ